MPVEVASAVSTNNIDLEVLRGRRGCYDDVAQRCCTAAVALWDAGHLEAREVVEAQYCEPAAREGHFVEGAGEVDDEPSCGSVGVAVPYLRHGLLQSSVSKHCTRLILAPISRSPPARGSHTGYPLWGVRRDDGTLLCCAMFPLTATGNFDEEILSRYLRVTTRRLASI